MSGDGSGSGSEMSSRTRKEGATISDPTAPRTRLQAVGSRGGSASRRTIHLSRFSELPSLQRTLRVPAGKGFVHEIQATSSFAHRPNSVLPSDNQVVGMHSRGPILDELGSSAVQPQCRAQTPNRKQ
jgi:hypothetical protein